MSAEADTAVTALIENIRLCEHAPRILAFPMMLPLIRLRSRPCDLGQSIDRCGYRIKEDRASRRDTPTWPGIAPAKHVSWIPTCADPRPHEAARTPPYFPPSPFLPLPLPPCFLQDVLTTGRVLCTSPFWAPRVRSAFSALAQRLRLLTKRPCLPPLRFRVNLETGASGTWSKVVRMRPLTESTLPTRTMWKRPLRSATTSGSRRSPPFERK